MNKRLKCLAAFITLLIVCHNAGLACGPFSLSAIFTFKVHPEYPLDKFARGEIGIVQPSYARSYLYVAYRYLNNGSFTESEQAALVNLWHDRLNRTTSYDDRQSIESWLAARKKVPGIAESPKIDAYRMREKPNQYESYLNCQNDTFETAIETLEARIKQFGADSANVRQWIEGQDQVFSNCGEGKQIPPALTAESNPMLRADRDYQIAAAHFYAADLDQAKTKFEAIGADKSSPWANVAPYLIARSLLRKASLGADEIKKPALQEAEEKLNAILKDSRLMSIHPDSARLLTLVRNRLDPAKRLDDLGRRLTDQTQNANLKQDLWDYTLLLDGYAGEEEEPVKPVNAPRTTDVTDWIVTFQSEAPADTDHALAKWQATRSLAWLVAAITKIDAKHPKAASLIEAAKDVRAGSPAFASVAFQSVRLLTESGKSAEARARLDQLLREHQSQFNLSAENLIRHQRMMAAGTLEEFLTYAPRLPAGMSWNEDGREIPVDPEEATEELKPLQGKPLFDTDAGNIINQRMPLTLLKRAALNAQLAPNLKRDLVQAAWLRAALLGDFATANELTPLLKTMVPESASFLDNFSKATRPDARKFAAIYAWLHFPGFEPVVDAGIGRGLALSEQDSYRDNWWCAASYASTPMETAAAKKPEPTPAFLTSADLATAQREIARLNSLGAGPTHISRQVLAWATLNPNDARVPEALHLAVKTTRYGCADKETGRWSKAAHDFLHRKYPGSDWAKRTPYWFKN